jgi:hypothetical protein
MNLIATVNNTTVPADHSYVEEEREELKEQLSALTDAEDQVQGLIDVLSVMWFGEDDDSEDLVDAHDEAERALITLSRALNERVEELREQLAETAE